MSSEIGGTVSVIDNATRAVKHKIAFEIPGVPDRVDPAGRRRDHEATAPRRSSRSGRPTGSRWSTPRRYEVEDYLLVGQRVWQLAFSPDEKFLYTTNGVSNDISVIDVEGDKVTKSVAVGSFPWGIAVKD